MSKRRIEYEPHDGSCYSRALKLLEQYARAREVGQVFTAAGAADEALRVMTEIAEDARCTASEAGFGAAPTGSAQR